MTAASTEIAVSYQQERSFGRSVGVAFLIVGGLLAWRGRMIAAGSFGVVGLLLVALAFVRPSLLQRTRAVWMRVALTLGYVHARIILTVIFFLLLTPFGLVWRLLGRDPLGSNRARWPGWVPHPARYRSRDHYRRMY